MNLGFKLALGALRSGTGAPFSVSLSGLTNGEAIIGDHASIGYTTDPVSATETVKWSASADPAAAATYGTGANPTDYTADDGNRLYLHVTDTVDGETFTVTRSALIRVARATAAGALGPFTFTQDKAITNQDLSADFTPGDNTLTYTISPALPAGLSLASNGILSGTPTEIATSASYTVTGQDAYGFDLTSTFTLEVVEFDFSIARSAFDEATDTITLTTDRPNDGTWYFARGVDGSPPTVASVDAITGAVTWAGALATSTAAVGASGDDVTLSLGSSASQASYSVVQVTGGTGLGAAGAFVPADLFSDASGTWAENTDIDTLFQDEVGTTPVTTTGQTVAFALDKSEGAGFSGGSMTGLGPELVTNGTFDTDLSGWTVGVDATAVIPTWDSGRVLLTRGSGGATGFSQNIGMLPGLFYELLLDVVSGFAALGSGFPITGGLNGAVKKVLPADGSSISFWPSNSNTVAILDNISVRKLPGSHRTQSSSSFRPQYQADDGLLYDGTDDRMETPLTPTTSGTIAARFNGDTASRVIVGSQGASDGRAFLALDASGRLGAGIGTQSTSTIFGGADIRGAWHTGIVTWDGTTVKLYLDGVEVYSAAQSGAVNTTVDFVHGALNANGTVAAFWDGTISDALVLDRVATPAEITNLNDEWSA